MDRATFGYWNRDLALLEIINLLSDQIVHQNDSQSDSNVKTIVNANLYMICLQINIQDMYIFYKILSKYVRIPRSPTILFLCLRPLALSTIIFIHPGQLIIFASATPPDSQKYFFTLPLVQLKYLCTTFP